MDEDRRQDGLEYAEELHRERLASLRDCDGNYLYDFGDEQESAAECECGITWPLDEMVDGLCPECRGI